MATGTDVKPLEVVMFMRDVESEPLYIQMKGRGVRTIGDEQLRNVTPNAVSKDCFFLVDAVGVTEHTKSIPEQGEGPDTEVITLKVLLERIAHGNLPDMYIKRLASTLARLHNKADGEQRAEFERLAHDSMDAIASRIYNALESGELPPSTTSTSLTMSAKDLSLLWLTMQMLASISLFLLLASWLR